MTPPNKKKKKKKKKKEEKKKEGRKERGEGDMPRERWRKREMGNGNSTGSRKEDFINERRVDFEDLKIMMMNNYIRVQRHSKGKTALGWARQRKASSR